MVDWHPRKGPTENRERNENMSYTSQYEEHLDAIAGEASEFQNCFTEAQNECSRRAAVQAERINKAKSLGLYIVVCEVEYHCRATDAFAGTYEFFVCAFPTRESALARAAELTDPQDPDLDSHYYVI